MLRKNDGDLHEGRTINKRPNLKEIAVGFRGKGPLIGTATTELTYGTHGKYTPYKATLLEEPSTESSQKQQKER